LKTDEISSVFTLKNQICGKFLCVRFEHTNFLTSKFAVIASKKIAPSAVERNYCKRVVREIFRIHQYQLQEFNILVQLRLKFQEHQFNNVFKEFIYLLKKIKS